MSTVHPSRQNLVPNSRPRVLSPDRRRSRSRSRSPPPHLSRQQEQQSQSRSSYNDRRASPVYESYDRVESRREDSNRNEEENRRRERDELRRDREMRDDEREQRGLEKELRSNNRATPERELSGYGRNDRGGYQGGRNNGGGGGQGEDYFASYVFLLFISMVC